MTDHSEKLKFKVGEEVEINPRYTGQTWVEKYGNKGIILKVNPTVFYDYLVQVVPSTPSYFNEYGLLKLDDGSF